MENGDISRSLSKSPWASWDKPHLRFWSVKTPIGAFTVPSKLPSPWKHALPVSIIVSRAILAWYLSTHSKCFCSLSRDSPASMDRLLLRSRVRDSLALWVGSKRRLAADTCPTRPRPRDNFSGTRNRIPAGMLPRAQWGVGLSRARWVPWVQAGSRARRLRSLWVKLEARGFLCTWEVLFRVRFS